MERKHESGEQRKRPVALPVTLLLLVISLIGNVFLYSKYLQNEQDRNYEKGQAIGQAAVSAGDFYNNALSGLGHLLESETLNQRTQALFELGKAYGSSQGVTDFIALAHDMQGTAQNEDELYKTLAAAEQDLSGIGGYEGKLTEADWNKVLLLQSDYQEQRDILFAFNFDALDIRSSSIRLGAGFGWLDIAEKLEQAVLQGPDAK